MITTSRKILTFVGSVSAKYKKLRLTDETTI